MEKMVKMSQATLAWRAAFGNPTDQWREKLKKKEPTVREKTILSTHPVQCGCIVIVWKDSVPKGFIKDSNPVTAAEGCVTQLLFLSGNL